MSGLIKWRGQAEEVSEPRRMVELVRREAPRTIGKHGGGDATPVGSARGNVAQYNRSSIIELPRWCAVYDELWLAAYEPGRNGEYEFVTSRELPKHQQSRYSEENIITLPAGFETDEERCACCQTWPPRGSTGAVFCDRCKAWVCFGRTTAKLFFACRESCGNRAQLTRYVVEQRGLTPGRRGGNFGTQF
jgi:hypothetical protein